MRQSEFARIDGYEGYDIDTRGTIRNRHGRTIKQSKDKYGYTTVTLCKDGKPKTLFVHRLVAQAFIKNPDHKKTVNHINGVKDDNRVENLEWATQGENNRHAYRTRLKEPYANNGEQNGRAKLTNAQAAEIRQKLEEGCKGTELAARYNVSTTAISRIKKHKSFNN